MRIDRAKPRPSRDTTAPEFCEESALEIRRGRREGRVQAAPMARQQQKKLAAVTTGLAEHPAFPARWCYGLYRALPGEPGFLAPVAREPRQLTSLAPASGRQDHTPSPSAKTSFVSRCIASIASRA